MLPLYFYRIICVEKKSPLFFLFTLLLPACFVNAETVEQLDKGKQFLPPFTAHYSILHKSDVVGTAVRQLSYQADGNINYHYETKIEWLIFSQTRSKHQFFPFIIIKSFHNIILTLVKVLVKINIMNGFIMPMTTPLKI